MPELPPPTLLILGSSLALCVLLTLLLAWIGRIRARAVRYELTDSVLTAAERAFLRPLESAAPSGTVVLMKVRLADFLRVPGGLRGGDWWKSFTRISSKHADFLLCDARSLRPLLVVELDDRSHERTDRRDRDEFVDRACRSAKLPILRVPCQRTYDIQILRGQLRESCRILASA